MTPSFDPYHRWLGIPSQEQPPHHYRLLGLAVFEEDADVIDSAANRQMAFLRECSSGPHSAASQKLLNEVAAARIALLNPKKKVVYDETLRAKLTPAKLTVRPADRHAAIVLDTPSVLPRPRNPLPIIAATCAGLGAVALAVILYSGMAGTLTASHPAPRPDFVPSSSKDADALAKITPAALAPKPGSRPDLDTPTAPKRPIAPPPAATDIKTETETNLPELEPRTKTTTGRETLEGLVNPAQTFESEESATTPSKSTPERVALAETPGEAKTEKTSSEAKSEKAPPKPPRTPAPDKPAQVEAAKLIRELFKAEFSARKPEERAALAKKLLSQAVDTGDTNSRYALYVEAKELAVSLGDVVTALGAANGLARDFEIDSSAERLAVLASLTAKLKPEDAGQFTSASTELANEFVDQNEFESAKRAFALAQSGARKSQNVALVTQLTARVRGIEEIRKAYDELKPSFEKLRTTPDDAEANLQIGKFVSFYKGDFEQGLPMLAKGNNEELATLAKQDLGMKDDGQKQFELANDWWSRGEEEREPLKTALRERAVYWYAMSKEKLKGLEKSQAESRMGAVTPRTASKKNVSLAFMKGTWQIKWTNGALERNVRWAESGQFFHGQRSVGIWKMDGDQIHVKFTIPEAWPDEYFRYTHPDRIEGRCTGNVSHVTGVGTREP